MWIDLKQAETELKKRWQYNYIWKRKQNNSFDKKTNFIYNIFNFEDLIFAIEQHLKKEKDFIDLKNYALNRWYNFKSAMVVEQIFNQNKIVAKTQNSKDREKDFFINNIAFDHKTSVYPIGFGKKLSYAVNNKKELINWFYKNQSSQQRQHFKNRLFVVLYESQNFNHWKLKAEIQLLQKAIENYLQNFNKEKLIELNFENQKVLSDVIFVVK